MISQQALNMQPELVQIRRFLHQNAEVAGQEVLAAKLVAEKLTEFGLEVRKAKQSQAVIGILSGQEAGPVLALRADMDALPMQEKSGLAFASANPAAGHCCGHDLHATVLLGTAKLLSQYKTQISGKIVFIFQPEEEALSGAKKILQENLLADLKIEAFLALHCWPDLPAGTVGVKKGPFMAGSEAVNIVVKGQAGHAAHPHRAIDSIVIAAQIINSLQTIISREIAPLEAAVLTFGKITGGHARNIIAEQVVLEGTFRYLNLQVREKVLARLARLVSQVAQAMQGEAEVIMLPDSATPAVINAENLADLVSCTAKEILGAEKVITLEAPSMGSEDFAFYLQRAPGCFFRLGTSNAEPCSKLALHNPELIFAEEALSTGVSVLTAAALAYFK